MTESNGLLPVAAPLGATALPESWQPLCALVAMLPPSCVPPATFCELVQSRAASLPSDLSALNGRWEEERARALLAYVIAGWYAASSDGGGAGHRVQVSSDGGPAHSSAVEQAMPTVQGTGGGAALDVSDSSSSSPQLRAHPHQVLPLPLSLDHLLEALSSRLGRTRRLSLTDTILYNWQLRLPQGSLPPTPKVQWDALRAGTFEGAMGPAATASGATGGAFEPNVPLPSHASAASAAAATTTSISSSAAASAATAASASAASAASAAAAAGATAGSAAAAPRAAATAATTAATAGGPLASRTASTTASTTASGAAGMHGGGGGGPGDGRIDGRRISFERVAGSGAAGSGSLPRVEHTRSMSVESIAFNDYAASDRTERTARPVLATMAYVVPIHTCTHACMHAHIIPGRIDGVRRPDPAAAAACMRMHTCACTRAHAHPVHAYTHTGMSSRSSGSSVLRRRIGLCGCT